MNLKVVLKWCILLVVSTVNVGVTNGYAQIDTAGMSIAISPLLDSVVYSCDDGNVKVNLDGLDSSQYVFKVTSITPNTLTAPVDNNTGVFNLVGATAASFAIISLNGACILNHTVNFDCPDNHPLPIDIISFTAKLVNAKNGLISWEVNEKDDVERYELEKSKDGVEFGYLATIYAAGTEDPKGYEYLDEQLFVGTNFYRLKVIKKNNSFVYTPVRLVRYITDPSLVVDFYPNPAKNKINVRIDIPQDDVFEYQLLDNLSRSVGVVSNRELRKGFNNFSIDISTLADANYFLIYKLKSEDKYNGVKIVKKVK